MTHRRSTIAGALVAALAAALLGGREARKTSFGFGKLLVIGALLLAGRRAGR